MSKLTFVALLAAGAALALSPAHLPAQEAPKPVSLGVQLEGKPEGAEIIAMLPDRTGAAIGLKVGDILLEAGGKAISQQVLGDYMKQLKAGDQVSFKVKRAGAVLHLTGKALAAPDGAPPPTARPLG